MRSLRYMFPLLVAAALLPASLSAQSNEIRLDPVIDGVAGGLALTGFVVTEFVVKKPNPPLPVVADWSQINALDALAVLPYDSTVSTISDISMVASIAYPVSILLVSDWKRWGGYGVVYAESLGSAITLKNLLKLGIDRFRPRIYWDGNPSGKQAEELNVSFPSGHTSTAFAAASCFATILGMEYADQPWALPLGIGGFVLAGGTGVLRIAGGQHFITDVVAGAVLGSASGFLATWLHYVAPAKTVALSEDGLVTMSGFANGDEAGLRFSLP